MLSRIFVEFDHLILDTPSRARERVLKRRLQSQIQFKWTQRGLALQDLKMMGAHTSYGCNQTACVWLGSSYRMGVDLELHEREMKTSSFQWLTQQEERHRFSLRPIEFWVIKEAAWKANRHSVGTFLSQYSVVNWNQKTSNGIVLFPERQPAWFQLIQEKEWIFAFVMESHEEVLCHLRINGLF